MTTKEQASATMQQLRFCRELLERLIGDANDAFQGDAKGPYWNLNKRHQLHGDIIRLRRELQRAVKIMSEEAEREKIKL